MTSEHSSTLFEKFGWFRWKTCDMTRKQSHITPPWNVRVYVRNFVYHLVANAIRKSMHFKISSNSFYGQINKLTLLQMLNKKTSNIGWNVCKNALLLNENIASIDYFSCFALLDCRHSCKKTSSLNGVFVQIEKFYI